VPTYSYRCDECESDFDLLRSRSEREAVASCPRCGTGNGRRLMTVCNIRSKGDGGGSSRVGGGGQCASCQSGSCASCGSR
jgi:putative FmdB family regulatory protein